MRTFIARFPFLLSLFALVVVVAAGCGGGDDGGGGGKVDLAEGRKLFQESCKSCHALADAEANGVFGPDLDALQPGADRLRAQIESGGGGMPAGILEGDDAQIVADYVAQVAGNPSKGSGSSSKRGSTKSSEDAGGSDL